jgi:hypothetical protein
MSLSCPPHGAVLNPVIGILPATCHHPIFDQFTRTTLKGASELFTAALDGQSPVPVVVDWLGVKVQRQAYCHVSYVRQRVAHALRAQLCDLLSFATADANPRSRQMFPLPLPLPTASEEYFEYIDVLEAASEYAEHARSGRRSRPFTMLELGAGFGFWTLTAHAALRQLWQRQRPDSGAPLPPSWYDFTLLEIDHAKQETLRTALSINGIRADRTRVIHAAFGDRDEKEGVVQNGNFGWYAVYACDERYASVIKDGGACKRKQFLAPRSKRADHAHLKKLGGAPSDMVSLPKLLANHSLVDLIDVDVQGHEWVVFNGSISRGARLTLDVLDAKVLRVHIGTHDVGLPNLSLGWREQALVETFVDRGWRPRWLVGKSSGGCADSKDFRSTRWGPICMADGALSFTNERLMKREGLLRNGKRAGARKAAD